MCQQAFIRNCPSLFPDQENTLLNYTETSARLWTHHCIQTVYQGCTLHLQKWITDGNHAVTWNCSLKTRWLICQRSYRYTEQEKSKVKLCEMGKNNNNNNNNKLLKTKGIVSMMFMSYRWNPLPPHHKQTFFIQSKAEHLEKSSLC